MNRVDRPLKRLLRLNESMPRYSRCAALLRSYRFVRWWWKADLREAILRWRFVWRDACNCDQSRS
jgi:hypothetical protein